MRHASTLTASATPARRTAKRHDGAPVAARGPRHRPGVGAHGVRGRPVPTMRRSALRGRRPGARWRAGLDRRDAASKQQCDEAEQREDRHGRAQAVDPRGRVGCHDGVGGGRGTCASDSATLRSASERNGTPLASSVCALEATLAGTFGLPWMPVKNEVVNAEMSTAPASAVPIEAPSWVPVFWSPPTSPDCSSGTEDTVTAPSCEAIAPSPAPASSSGTVTISGPAPESSRATSSTSPANNAMKPRLTTRRGDALGRNLGTPAANSSNISESGSSRTPVSIAESPSATDKNKGTTKNRPPGPGT